MHVMIRSDLFCPTARLFSALRYSGSTYVLAGYAKRSLTTAIRILLFAGSLLTGDGPSPPGDP